MVIDRQNGRLTDRQVGRAASDSDFFDFFFQSYLKMEVEELDLKGTIQDMLQ